MEEELSVNQNLGLTSEGVLQSAKKHGTNQLKFKQENSIVRSLKSLLKEPMILLLLLASTIYFITGDQANGIFLLSAILLVSFISLYQESRSRKALENLKELTKPLCKVIRDSKQIEIHSDDLVLGDLLVLEEGDSIAADAELIQINDFTVNESILTGESFAVGKDIKGENRYIFQGTTIATGRALAIINAIGNATRLGKIGKSLESIPDEKTPLEIQIGNFVKKMVIAGFVVFILVWGIHFYLTKSILTSLLKALTLAMSVIPEEIPMAMTTFMALGARRLMLMGIIVKQMKTVETLGSATVICTDKTGTLTENKMSLSKLFVLSNQAISDAHDIQTDIERELIRISMWASEPVPFDPMEVALHDAYSTTIQTDERKEYKLIHEYPLIGNPPMMTHVFENNSKARIIAAKGAPEAILNVCHSLTQNEKNKIQEIIHEIAADGYRILAVAKSNFNGTNFPPLQTELDFEFIGIVAFEDPPKENIKQTLDAFYKAGIKVKIVTGDNAETTKAIAREIGLKGSEESITGSELMKLSDEELKRIVNEKQIFARMFPDAKMKIINALKSNKEIVAMTGDGVNDGPALKAAHIGIAMGKKGSEIAKQSASLILVEDDLSKMVDAVSTGRRIYANLKKANRYIISIHIPIILTVFIPLALGWMYPSIFSPIHIIFLELIMGPTCSIVFENEPIEKNAMTQDPRPFTHTFFSWKELNISIIQGLMITLGVLGIYQYAIHLENNEDSTRTMVFLTLVTANILLTLINRSFYYSIFQTLRSKNNLVPIIISLTILLTIAMLSIDVVEKFFGFTQLSIYELVISIFIGSSSVIWFEGIKWYRRKNVNYIGK
jgi:Ca2+-transporting ATPase